MTKIFSTQSQLEEIATIIKGYLKLPFSGDSVPGALLENVFGNVRNSEILNTYDFIDVLNREQKIGWQIKSTKASTPVTWKRAKIPNALALIEEARTSPDGMKKLGDSIIRFCNEHALKSMNDYDLDAIGYARLIIHSTGDITYFERILCTKEHPDVFPENDFVWNWSTPKKTKKKEQLPALHGKHIPSNSKWFAWHGLGENQLHFNGEKSWWPLTSKNKIDFSFPEGRLSQKQFMEILNQISMST